MKSCYFVNIFLLYLTSFYYETRFLGIEAGLHDKSTSGIE